MLPDWLRPKGASTRLAVDVTFLEVCSSRPSPVLPEGFSLSRMTGDEVVALYRFLYLTVGQDYCWWMRRSMPDAELGEILHDPAVHFMVLRDSRGEPAGFYELDLRQGGDANLAYFGLLPQAMGRGLGRVLLDHAVARAFGAGSWRLRVNTCTLDHPNALPNYRRAGFSVRHIVSETWDVPDEYVPERLKRL
ncbi:GNAT family N-acetyltransferase [Gluconobacter albidus]|uniref:Acetyltransferase n=1 Tax=Gluconobacter albidus TaxID=318683 RepID=A0AAW3QU14_9PROT|nr:GNAT family N-acetyltransferase [Gluconobacter albidus]KXV36792.1 acetyltransferase [Gluconobacter albidus]GBQ83380.1 acetyltransferase [Gluconobacter albidus NBRC 3250]GLQ70554.1 N-acetyltransferase [Gluconobacter albidus]